MSRESLCENSLDFFVNCCIKLKGKSSDINVTSCKTKYCLSQVAL